MGGTIVFVYYSTQQSEANRDYHKGVLFEQLLARYLDASGYDVSVRRKHNSLEYDIEGIIQVPIAEGIGLMKQWLASRRKAGAP